MSEYVNFGNQVVHKFGLGQTQYISRYINPNLDEEYPMLGEGLRFKGNPSNYHNVEIHVDDIEKFLRRYRAYTELQNTWKVGEETPFLKINKMILYGEI